MSRPGRPTRRVVVGAVAAMAIAACGGTGAPSAPSPPATVALAIDVIRAPDPMLQFFGSEVHVRLSGDGWTSEWIVPDGPSSTHVPSGVSTLEMWTVVRGDTGTCVPDIGAALESCFGPIIGNGQTCSIRMAPEPESSVSVRFSLLAQERCRLVGAPD